MPSLQTARLHLRPHRLTDFPAERALWSDPIVTRYLGGRPFTEEETWARFLRYAGHWAMLGFGYWAVEEQSTGAFLGELGFANYKRDLQPAMPDIPELGWAFLPGAHGKGYATEAVKAALHWGQQSLTSPATICLIHPDNLASIRVAEKCGFHVYGPATYKGERTIIFERKQTVESGRLTFPVLD